jgi:3-oxoacyl-[acyl-carrier-protein] synthase-3
MKLESISLPSGSQKDDNMGIRIAGTGSYLPEKIRTNAEIEKLVDTNDEWIRTRTGIEERRIAAADETASTMAIQAAEKALATAGVDGRDLDAIVLATISPDYIFPNTAALIQHHFQCRQAFCFDLSAACAGFVSSLEVGFSLMRSFPQKYRNVLVCGSDKLSVIVDWTDRNTCILFGDGAGCAVLQNDGSDAPDSILASSLHADGGYTDVLRITAGGSYMPASIESVQGRKHFVYMEGRETFKLAVNGMVSSSEEVLAQAGITIDQVALVIPHQANLRIMQAVAKRLGIGEDRVFCNIQRYGNTSSASIGIALDEACRSGRIKRGDLVLFTSFGGGLAWGSILIRY